MDDTREKSRWVGGFPLSLHTTAVCLSKSVVEFFADFAVASSAGKQKIETRGQCQKKENQIQKFEVEI